MPNTENINKVIEAIRSEDNFFNMYNWEYVPSDTDWSSGRIRNYLTTVGAEMPTCRTPACIGGWASALSQDNMKAPFFWSDAADYLGLSEDQDEHLFQPNTPIETWLKITRQEAIATLERLRDTGEVLWIIDGKEIPNDGPEENDEDE